MNKYLLFGLIFLLVACGTEAPPNTPTPENQPLPDSAWGDVLLVAQAEQLQAPSFVPLNNGLFFAWTGSQEGEARLFSRGINDRTQIMALKAFHPSQQNLYAGNGEVMMLWLDRNFNTTDMRLQAARLSQNGIAEVGIITISDIATRHYSAIHSDPEVVTIVYSAGLGLLSNLYLQRIDVQARPFTQEELRVDADFPALLADESGLVLFWLEDTGQRAYSARLGDNALSEINLVGRVNIGSEASVEAFYVAFDGTYAYLFWQIRSWDASRYVIMSAGTIGGEFSEAVRIEANFAIPAENTTSAGLPVALNIGNQLGIAYFSGGVMGEFQPIVDSGVLLGAPNIALLPNGQLALAWSMPATNGYANLFYTEQNQ